MQISPYQKAMMRARRPMQFDDLTPSSAAIKRASRKARQPRSLSRRVVGIWEGAR